MVRCLYLIVVNVILWVALVCQHPGCLGRPLGHSSYDEQNLADELLILRRMLQRENMERELEREQRDNKVHARLFLERFGYLPDLKENVQHEPVNFKNAVKNMQRMYHLNATGLLDQITVKMMQVRRCGMPDMTPKEYLNVSLTRSKSHSALMSELITNNFYVPGYKWEKKTLSWKLKNIHPRLNEQVTRNALRQAFKFWSDASQLTFHEVNSKADINMEFVRGTHQDGAQNAFDGPSGVLAHAFYPESGETHFDADEYWTDGTSEGTNLMIVAAHELGHSLGLGHSNIQGSLMAPYYQGYDPSFKLHSDDIMGIQSIYGARYHGDPRTSTRPTTRTTKISTTTQRPATITTKTRSTKKTTTTATFWPTNAPGVPSNCDVVYQAITQTHDYRVLIFNGQWFWRVSEYGLDPGFPLTISTYYEKPPEDISAAIFSWRTYFTYFFKGNQVWKYYGYQLVENMPKTIETPGYPYDPKGAIAARDGSIRLIKAGSVWDWDEEALDVKNPAKPTSLDQLYPGAPSNFDSIVRINNEPHVYFFKGQNYYKFSEDHHRIMDDYPKPSGPVWMGIPCGGEPYTPK